MPKLHPALPYRTYSQRHVKVICIYYHKSRKTHTVDAKSCSRGEAERCMHDNLRIHAKKKEKIQGLQVWFSCLAAGRICVLSMYSYLF